MSNFFRIHSPYIITKVNDKEWVTLNREYAPLGFSQIPNGFRSDTKDNRYNIYSVYRELTNEKIIEIIGEEYVKYDKFGNICMFYLYNDNTNPTTQNTQKNKYWEIYFEKLRQLAYFEN